VLQKIKESVSKGNGGRRSSGDKKTKGIFLKDNV
jgi:hypothetical protein